MRRQDDTRDDDSFTSGALSFGIRVSLPRVCFECRRARVMVAVIGVVVAVFICPHVAAASCMALDRGHDSRWLHRRRCVLFHAAQTEHEPRKKD